MVTMHPNILERDGEKAFVVLPYEEFVMIEEELQEYEDLKELRPAKGEEATEPSVPLQDVKKELGLWGERPAGRRFLLPVFGVNPRNLRMPFRARHKASGLLTNVSPQNPIARLPSKAATLMGAAATTPSP